MRRLFKFMTMSLDGYFDGPNHDISWHNADNEFNEFAIEQFAKLIPYFSGEEPNSSSKATGQEQSTTREYRTTIIVQPPSPKILPEIPGACYRKSGSGITFQETPVTFVEG